VFQLFVMAFMSVVLSGDGWVALFCLLENMRPIYGTTWPASTGKRRDAEIGG
jgi:hypothetical protein